MAHHGESPEGNNEQELEAFQKEIAELRDSDGTMKSVIDRVAPEFSAEDLTREDMVIWEKVKAGTADKNDLTGYRDSFFIIDGEIRRQKPGVTASRNAFSNFISDRISALIYKAEAAELKKRKLEI